MDKNTWINEEKPANIRFWNLKRILEWSNTRKANQGIARAGCFTSYH